MSAQRPFSDTWAPSIICAWGCAHLEDSAGKRVTRFSFSGGRTHLLKSELVSQTKPSCAWAPGRRHTLGMYGKQTFAFNSTAAFGALVSRAVFIFPLSQLICVIVYC